VKSIKNAQAWVGACLLLLTTTCLVFANSGKSSKGSHTGTWDCMAHLSGEDDIPFTMMLEQKDEAVTGSITSHEGELQITSGTYKGDTLELHLETPEAKYVVTGKLAGDQFKGQWSKDPDGLQGNWEGKKSAMAEPSSQ
jgi:hypothetical protein